MEENNKNQQEKNNHQIDNNAIESKIKNQVKPNKSTWYTKWYFGLIVASLIILSSCVGCSLIIYVGNKQENNVSDNVATEEKEQAEQQKNISKEIGEKFSTNNWEITIYDALQIEKINKENDKGKYILIGVSQKNIRSTKISPNFENIFLVDSKDREYKYDESLNSLFRETFKISKDYQVKPNEEVYLDIIYKVDEDSKNLIVNIVADSIYEIPVDFKIKPKDDDDQDGLSNNREFLLGTNSQKSDTDDDGYSDLEEIKTGNDPFIDELKPIINITSHQDGDDVNEKQIELKGIVQPINAEIFINDQKAGVDQSGNFGMMIDLNYGNNLINIVAKKGDKQEQLELNIESTKKVVSQDEINSAQNTWNGLLAINYIRDYEVDTRFDAMYLRITLDDWNMNGYQEKKEFLYLMRRTGNILFGISEVYVRDYHTNEMLGIASRLTESVKK